MLQVAMNKKLIGAFAIGCLSTLFLGTLMGISSTIVREG